MDPHDKADSGRTLADAYLEKCKEKQKRPNALLTRRLADDTENVRARGYISLKCCGNELDAFLERVQDDDVLTLLEALEAEELKIKDLELSYNQLTDESAAHILKHSPCLSNLESLIIKSNNLTGEGVQNICTALRGNSSLRKVDFSYNNLGEKGGIAVAGLVETCSNLKELNLAASQLDVLGLVSVTTAVKDSSKVHTSNRRQKNLIYWASTANSVNTTTTQLIGEGSSYSFLTIYFADPGEPQHI